jgi:NADH-quinone oxidoreductase subunit M
MTTSTTIMSSVPWLTILGVIPLVGSLLVAFVPGSALMAKRLALGVSLLTLVVGVVASLQFDRGSSAQFQLGEQYSWIPQFGVSYALGVDGIALVLILMSLVLTPICLLAAWRDLPEDDAADERRVKTYFALLLLLETFMVGVFAATDVFLFYVFFEAMLIPVYFLIGRFGGARRQYAAMKFLLFSLAGGLVMLVAVIALYIQGPGGTDGFLVERLTGLSIDPTTERLLFVGFFIAFAIKAPMVPFHTWLPDAATESSPATATLLVGVLDKVGTFGMIRFCLQLFPEASHWATPVVVVLAVVSVLYGALLAIGQTDMMRLIAYTSVSHFGFIVLGIFAFTTTGGAGSTLYMVNHGFSTAALFLFAAMVVRRGGSKRIPDYGGWQRVTPGLAGIFLVAGLSALSLPGLSTFVSEFLVLVGSFPTRPAAAVIATAGIILAALYVLLMYKRVMTGPKPESLAADGVTVDDAWRKSSGGVRGFELPSGRRIVDLTTREKLVAAPLIAAFLVLGFFPNLALNAINPAVDKSMSHVQNTPAAGNAAEGSTR